MFKTTRQRSNSQKTFKHNQELRRENSRLRKQLQKLNAAMDSFTYDDEEQEAELEKEFPQPTLIGKPEIGCPKCQSALNIVEAGVFVFSFCTGCKYRERKSIPSSE